MKLREAIKKALKGVVAFFFDKAQSFDTTSSGVKVDTLLLKVKIPYILKA